jgi:hypothetical protein
MKTFTSVKRVFSIAVMLALAFSVLAAPGTAWSSLRDEVREFHLFMRDRPRISADLRANPNLVNNRRYLNQHEDLARFLRRRPALRDEIRYNPNRVFSRYYVNDRYDRYDRYDRFGRWR